MILIMRLSGVGPKSSGIPSEIVNDEIKNTF